MSEGYIRETSELIASSDGWGANAIMLFATIVILIVVGGMFYFFIRNFNRQNDKIVEVTKDTTIAISNNTEAINRQTEVTKELLGKALDSQDKTHEIAKSNGVKLDEIKAELKEMSFRVRGRDERA